MDHPRNYFICLVIIAILASQAVGSCRMDIHDECTYTLICEHHPSAITTPTCANTRNVTFIIQYSQLDTLTAGFFATTNFDSKVKHFKASECIWNTIETSAFKYYTKLVSIDISGIELEHINDDAFSSLGYLRKMNISNNKIKHLNQRSLALRLLAETIETIDLSKNLLETIQNDVFSSLSSLSELYLNRNNLQYLSDDCFFNLKKLTELQLQDNKITELNLTLIHLRSLKRLDLSNNLLRKISSYETTHLTGLEIFNVSNNKLEIVEGNSFSKMAKIQFIDLSHNKIHSPIESFMFMNNNFLMYLSLNDNNITQIHDNAFAYNSLEYLNFENNNITGSINRSTLSGLFNLTKLNLSNQHITDIQDKGFADLRYLQYLNLSRNYIENISNTSFEFANGSSLYVLDISYNNISDLYFLQNITSNLTELYINYNKLTALRSGILNNLDELKILDISNNEIQFLEPHSMPLSHLQYLNIYQNNLQGKIASDVFGPAPRLRYLDLSNFNFTYLDENAFLNLNLLSKLNLSNNNLKFVNSNNFKGMDKMYSLDLSHNKLKGLKLNEYLDNLKAIYLNNNNFSNISDIFSNSSVVLYIDLSYNNFTNMTSAGFQNISEVKVLHLSYNKIEVFNNEETNALGKLSDLTLHSNRISQINLTYFKELIRVDLSNNNISQINITMFKYLESLQAIDLSNNKIKFLSPGTFQDLKMLKLLNLSNNDLADIRYGTFKGINRTEVLDISKNQLSVLDVYVFHECTELKKLVLDYNFIKTIDVDKLVVVTSKLDVLSVGGNPVSCKEIVKHKQLEKSRHLEVTSIDKIFHEDNVHGIRCGDIVIQTSSDKPEESYINNSRTDNIENSITNTNVLWIVLGFFVFFLSIGTFIFYKTKFCDRLTIRHSTRDQLRNSMSGISSDFNNDLLS